MIKFVGIALVDLTIFLLYNEGRGVNDLLTERLHMIPISLWIKLVSRVLRYE